MKPIILEPHIGDSISEVILKAVKISRTLGEPVKVVGNNELITISVEEEKKNE